MLFVQWNKKHFFMSVTLFSVLPFQSFDLILSSVKNNPTNPMHHFKRVLFCVFFLSSVFGVGFSYAQCNNNVPRVGETVTFVWDSSNNGLPAPVTVNGVKDNYRNYISLNVVGGVTYRVDSSNIVVCSHQGQLNHQSGSFTPNESGEVRIYYNGWFNNTTLTISVVGGENTVDIPRDIPPPNENNKWRGYFYKGANQSGTPPLPSKYLGYFDLPESFNTVTNSTLFQIYSQGSTVPRLLADSDYFLIRFFMRSTRKGLYYVNLGADDGTRLEIDNTLVYDNWDNKSRPQWEPVNNQIINLSGNSLLSYEFYNGNGRLWYLFEISDANKIIENTIVGEQTICQGGQASPITGDDFKRRAQHNFNPTFQFQWHYATNPNGRRTAITGAIQKDFTPDTKTTPFNQAGTYYLFREASVRFKNIGVAEKTESIFSNPVKVTVLPQPIVSIDPPKQVCQGADAQIRIEINNGSGGTPPFTFYYEVNDKPLQSNPSYNNIFYIPVNTSEADTFKYKYLYVTDGNNCKVELEEGSDDITVMAPSITAPENVAWCLPEIVSAVYDNNGNTTITQNSYVLPLGDTTLDVGVNSVPCCLNPTLKWTINNDLSKTRTGQPSTIGNISFENATSSDKVYTITYWLECNGQKYSHITRQVRITPRPQIHFSN
ncbi:hypothetical protein [Capnocytophaga canimorsus]|uniref:hypothetical protein n=2 Tax=Capnocytophaga canimorsus TaxID=28188 RepID=UPI000589958A|nr:hypothetical protein [Capnocytophaga canimorsus]CEN49582.1 conserved hypothetical protein [Capnocytophaga canimorsus]VEJ19982.1 Uncharacterised protein [Capnocytophaga canimorsus]